MLALRSVSTKRNIQAIEIKLYGGSLQFVGDIKYGQLVIHPALGKVALIQSGITSQLHTYLLLR